MAIASRNQDCEPYRIYCMIINVPYRFVKYGLKRVVPWIFLGTSFKPYILPFVVMSANLHDDL